jgi:hypothetical protein
MKELRKRLSEGVGCRVGYRATLSFYSSRSSRGLSGEVGYMARIGTVMAQQLLHPREN